MSMIDRPLSEVLAGELDGIAESIDRTHRNGPTTGRVLAANWTGHLRNIAKRLQDGAVQHSAKPSDTATGATTTNPSATDVPTWLQISAAAQRLMAMLEAKAGSEIN